jgi:hypothetical protein
MNQMKVEIKQQIPLLHPEITVLVLQTIKIQQQVQQLKRKDGVAEQKVL